MRQTKRLKVIRWLPQVVDGLEELSFSAINSEEKEEESDEIEIEIENGKKKGNKGTKGHPKRVVCTHPLHQEMVETLIFPVRSDHMVDP